MSKITDYLNFIGIEEPLFNRITYCIEFYELLKIPIEDIFISEYVQQDGSRVFESLWFFNESYVIECRQFATSDNFDYATIKNRIKHWRITKLNYDFKRTTSNSRMTLNFAMDTAIDCDLKASGINCDYLKGVVIKYVIPNALV